MWGKRVSGKEVMIYLLLIAAWGTVLADHPGLATQLVAAVLLVAIALLFLWWGIALLFGQR